MELLTYIIIGIATAFNFLIIKWKVEHVRYADATLDVVTLTILSFLFSGSYSGLVVATVASAVISLYLLAFPPRIPALF